MESEAPCRRGCSGIGAAHTSLVRWATYESHSPDLARTGQSERQRWLASRRGPRRGVTVRAGSEHAKALTRTRRRGPQCELERGGSPFPGDRRPDCAPRARLPRWRGAAQSVINNFSSCARRRRARACAGGRRARRGGGSALRASLAHCLPAAGLPHPPSLPFASRRDSLQRSTNTHTCTVTVGRVYKDSYGRTQRGREGNKISNKMAPWALEMRNSNRRLPRKWSPKRWVRAAVGPATEPAYLYYRVAAECGHGGDSRQRAGAEKDGRHCRTTFPRGTEPRKRFPMHTKRAFPAFPARFLFVARREPGLTSTLRPQITGERKSRKLCACVYVSVRASALFCRTAGGAPPGPRGAPLWAWTPWTSSTSSTTSGTCGSWGRRGKQARARAAFASSRATRTGGGPTAQSSLLDHILHSPLGLVRQVQDGGAVAVGAMAQLPPQAARHLGQRGRPGRGRARRRRGSRRGRRQGHRAGREPALRGLRVSMTARFSLGRPRRRDAARAVARYVARRVADLWTRVRILAAARVSPFHPVECTGESPRTQGRTRQWRGRGKSSTSYIDGSGGEAHGHSVCSIYPSAGSSRAWTGTWRTSCACASVRTPSGATSWT